MPALVSIVQRVKESHQGAVLFQQIAMCPSCHGRGSLIEQPCSECAGRGETIREETRTVRMPAGAEDGMVLRVPGHGMPSEEKGGIAGNGLPKFGGRGRGDIHLRIQIRVPERPSAEQRRLYDCLRALEASSEARPTP